MRILHVIVGLYTGGAEHVLCNLLERSDGERFEHCVVTLMRGGALRGRARDAGARLYELGLRRNHLPLAAAATLVRLVRKERPDVVQGWMYHGNAAATLVHLSSLRRLSLLWSIHHSLHDVARERLLTRSLIALGARTSRLTSGIIYVSKTSERQHEAAGYDPSRTVVIPNGTDCELFRPRTGAGERLRDELGVGSDVALIGMVAAYRRMKDHGNLLRAASLLKERVAFRLVLVGLGVDPANRELVGQIERGELGGHVSLLGERHDIPDLMPGFDVAVLPSAWGEAFPLVLCEAMASGVPCVATDIGDCRWIVGDTGTIVPRQEPAALAEALGRIIEIGADGRRQLGERARARIVRDFSLGDIVRRYERLYEHVGEPAAKSLATGR